MIDDLEEDGVEEEDGIEEVDDSLTGMKILWIVSANLLTFSIFVRWLTSIDQYLFVKYWELFVGGGVGSLEIFLRMTYKSFPIST